MVRSVGAIDDSRRFDKNPSEGFETSNLRFPLARGVGSASLHFALTSFHLQSIEPSVYEQIKDGGSRRAAMPCASLASFTRGARCGGGGASSLPRFLVHRETARCPKPGGALRAALGRPRILRSGGARGRRGDHGDPSRGRTKPLQYQGGCLRAAAAAA